WGGAPAVPLAGPVCARLRRARTGAERDPGRDDRRREHVPLAGPEAGDEGLPARMGPHGARLRERDAGPLPRRCGAAEQPGPAGRVRRAAGSSAPGGRVAVDDGRAPGARAGRPAVRGGAHRAQPAPVPRGRGGGDQHPKGPVCCGAGRRPGRLAHLRPHLPGPRAPRGVRAARGLPPPPPGRLAVASTPTLTLLPLCGRDSVPVEVETVDWFGWFAAEHYDIARVVLQRGIAAIYLVAFLAVLRQFPALLGEHGLLPVRPHAGRVNFWALPTLFHARYSDRAVRVVGGVGVLLAAAVVAGLPQRGPWWVPLAAFGVLYLLYLSVVNIGQVFYGFGWESLLLEAGFLAAFLGSEQTGTPVLTLLAFKWLLLRVEFGAGLIKIRGDAVWRDLTALYYHHETQPMPGPLSWFFHHLPRPLHEVEVAANHVVQLGVPFLLFAPQPVATWAA